MTDTDTTPPPSTQDTPRESRTLSDRIQEGYAPAWRPEEGDTIVGHVEEMSIGNTDYGDYPIVTLFTDQNDRRSVHAFHTTLQEALIDAEPSIGEEIAVKYNGLRFPKSFLDKSGSPTPDAKKKEGTKDDPRYHDYRVIVQRAPGDFWGGMRRKRDERQNSR